MATDNKKKFSELDLITSFTGKEIVPMAYLGTNHAATLEALKSYMSDSALQFYSHIIEEAVTVNRGIPDLSEGEIAIVYLSYYGIFAVEKTISGVSSYYYSFPTRGNYMADANTPRTDRVFFNTDDKHLYIYNGVALVDLFDSVRIHVLTEEELENLQNPIEGAIYATLE